MLETAQKWQEHIWKSILFVVEDMIELSCGLNWISRTDKMNQVIVMEDDREA